MTKKPEKHPDAINVEFTTDEPVSISKDRCPARHPSHPFSVSRPKNLSKTEDTLEGSKKSSLRPSSRSISMRTQPIFSLDRSVDDTTGGSSQSSLSSSQNDSYSSDGIICESPISESFDNAIPAPKKRGSLEDCDDSNIRRSWSPIEARHFKGLFSRKRGIRNSYAYTNSKKANNELATESELHVLNHVVGNPDETSRLQIDIFALQADVEKETCIVTRSIQMRKFISSELYCTEQSYLQHLKALKKTFMDPFIEAANSPNPLVDPNDIQIIFAYIKNLIDLSTVIVEDLESSVDPWQDSESSVGEVFVKYQHTFEVLLHYAENHQQSRVAINRANENVLCRKFIQSLKKKESNRFNLPDYMIMPIQRVTRYCLLLQGLKKYTPDTHTDYDDICQALDNMKSLATKCDNIIQRP